MMALSFGSFKCAFKLFFTSPTSKLTLSTWFSSALMQAALIESSTISMPFTDSKFLLKHKVMVPTPQHKSKACPSLSLPQKSIAS